MYTNCMWQQLAQMVQGGEHLRRNDDREKHFHPTFKFGDVLGISRKVVVSVTTGSKNVKLKIDTVVTGIPFLISNTARKKANTILDLDYEMVIMCSCH